MRTSTEIVADLVARHRAGTPLWINHPLGGQRVIAEILPTDSGFVFADTGWPTNDSGHPFHRIDGPARDADAGRVVIDLHDEDGGGQATVAAIDDQSPPQVLRAPDIWRTWLASAEGKPYDGAAATVLKSVKRGLAPDARLV